MPQQEEFCFPKVVSNLYSQSGSLLLRIALSSIVFCTSHFNVFGDVVVFDTLTDFDSNAVDEAFLHFWDRAFEPESFVTGIIATPLQGANHLFLNSVEIGIQFAIRNPVTFEYEFVTGNINLTDMNLRFRAFYFPVASDFSIQNFESGNAGYVHDFSVADLLAGSGMSMGIVNGRETYYIGVNLSHLGWYGVDSLGYAGLVPYYSDYETNFSLDLLSGLTLSTNNGFTIGTADLALHQFGLEAPTTLFIKTGYSHAIARVTMAIPEPNGSMIMFIAYLSLLFSRCTTRLRDNASHVAAVR
ncbi:MAG TPA: hypothetical protein PKD64_04465 [Pirellulaceae bacterium]|nr:hypothetical protein [Pirellulaceae bacterium]HMO91427.1 hypothetical protein [Pirellulaceae bacterium]HMP69496.1 hypothetical protein [Pirellulaceae bacterium]